MRPDGTKLYHSRNENYINTETPIKIFMNMKVSGCSIIEADGTEREADYWKRQGGRRGKKAGEAGEAGIQAREARLFYSQLCR